MVMQAIGLSLPLALAVALSPFPVIGIVLILSGRHGRPNGPLFAIGWVAGLTAVVAVVALLFGGADDPDSTSAAIVDWLRVVAGVVLIVLGIRTWIVRPAGADAASVPGWMASLEDASAGRALLLGAALGGANPKNLVLAASATAAIVEVGLEGTDLLVAAIAFIAVASCTVIGAVVAHFVGGERAASLLDGIRQFMLDNNTVITVIVLVILGATVLGGGLAGLGR
jgi:threonine/homoserine/homoserine lactone efflux protein